MASRKGFEKTVKLMGATRKPSSTNGNPRFELWTDDGPYDTQSDAACGYEVTNFTNRISDGESVDVILSCTPTGKVYGIRYPDAE